MAFKLESTLDGAGTILEDAIMMTDLEAGADGEAMVITSGRLTKAGATVKPQAILAQTTTAGTSVSTSYVRVRDDQVFKVGYTGAAPTVGIKVYRLDSTGLLVDGDQNSGGKVEILSVDTTTTTCRVKFND